MAYPRPQQGPTAASEIRALWYSLALTVVTLVDLAVRFVGIARYPALIYDEFYYVPAADVLLRRHPAALVKNMIPGIDPNLLSHPPVSKELIAGAIYWLGQHPWVWRLPGAALGAAVPLLVAGIAMALFQNRLIAVLAAALASVDGLLVVMSRVAIPDSAAVFFVMAALWMLLAMNNRLRQSQPVSLVRWVLMGVLLGLATATEWIGGQALLLVWAWLLLHRSSRREWRKWLPATTVVPFLVYYATYFYAWPSGYHEPWLPKNPFVAFFKLQELMLKDMWTLKFYHPWTANAWSWLGIPRPTAMILSTTAHQSIKMMAFPDPLIVWTGVAALLAGIWAVRRDRRLAGPWAFLSLWFLCFYATWLATPRSKFLYYFSSASVGLDIATAAGLVLAWQAASHYRQQRVLLGALSAWVGVLGASVVYLLPLWVGMAMPLNFYHKLWWPPTWNSLENPASATSTQSFSLTMNPKSQAIKAWSNFPSPSGLPPLPVPWTVYRGSSSHNSAYNAVPGLTKSYALKLANAGLAAAPAVSGSTAFVGTDNNQLYAVNLLSGSVKWGVGVPNMVQTTPLVDRGMVVVGLGNSTFRRYSDKLGWVRGSGANGLMAFNAVTGNEVWYAPTQGETMATPVIAGNTVYDVTGASRLVAVNLTSGRRLWSLPLRGFDSLSSPVVIGSHLYVATNAYFTAYPAQRSTVWSVNLATHQVSWARKLPVASGLSDCSIASSGSRLFVAGVPRVSNGGQGSTVSQRLFALSRTSGRILWARSLGRGQVSALDQPEEGTPMAQGSLVYEGSPATDRVEVFNAASGRLVWNRRLPAGVTANPVLVGGDLLVAGMNGRLYRLSAQSGAVVGQDPYHFGNIGSASPLIVGGALLQSTLSGELVVQRLGH